MADNFSYEIKEHVGVISEGKGGWKLELNLVSWSEHPAKYDIRSWDEHHEKMGKGATLTKEELKVLKEILNGMNLD